MKARDRLFASKPKGIPDILSQEHNAAKSRERDRDRDRDRYANIATRRVGSPALSAVADQAIADAALASFAAEIEASKGGQWFDPLIVPEFF